MRTAVILAAGRGIRLRTQGVDRPKGFIEMGGTPIIERSLDRLTATGVSRTVIVTGHQSRYYEQLAHRRPGVELIHNPVYAESGSMYSLYLARKRIDGDFLLLESDLIYEARALETLLAATSPDSLLVSGPGSGDEVYVEARDGRLTGLSKRRQDLQGDVIGELVGITRLTIGCLAAMTAHAETVFRDSRHLEYEQALVAAARSIAIACPIVGDLAWSEIDDDRQLARAASEVYPLIVQRDAESEA